MVDEKVKIISLSAPMKVRSPLGFRSSYNLDEAEKYEPNKVSSNQLSVSSKIPVKITSSNKEVQTMATSQENLRKPSILSLRSLSMSLRMIMPLRALRGSEEHMESLKTIDETKMATFRDDSEFQKYSQHQPPENKKSRKFTIFKNQKIYDRRSSMSDIPDPNDPKNHPQQHRNLQAQHASGSATNIKHEHIKHKEVKKKEIDKTAETLKEVRRRNLETAKRLQSAPRRISTAY